MKKLAVLLFVQLFFATVVLAQAQIGSFYGLKLGMTISEVRSVLSSQGKVLIDATSAKAGQYYTEDVRLGDSSFELLYLYFSDSKLKSGEFFNGFWRDISSGPDYVISQLYSQYQSLTREYKLIFNSMKYSLTNKYGNPIIDDGDIVIWRKGANQIKMQYLNRETSGFPHEIETQVRIKYETISNSINY